MGMSDEMRGHVARPGRSGAFTGNDAEDSKRIIHGYAVDLDKAQEIIRDRDKAIAELRGLLKRLEWVEWASEWAIYAMCPICNESRHEGHDSDCELARAIGGDA